MTRHAVVGHHHIEVAGLKKFEALFSIHGDL